MAIASNVGGVGRTNGGLKPSADAVKAVTIPLRELPAPPKDFQADEIAKWYLFGNMLIAREFIDVIDLPLLEALCRSYCQYDRCMQEVRLVGEVVSGSTGSPIINPASVQARSILPEVRRMLGEFGMTPTMRARIVAAGVGSKNKTATDDFDDFVGEGAR